MELRLAVVQPEALTGADAPKNVDRAVAYIRQAARDGARLVALPETYPGPYTVPIDYSPHEALSAVAREEKVWLREEQDRRMKTRPWRTKPGSFTQWLRPELYHDIARGREL